jgi:hypothetical protein
MEHDDVVQLLAAWGAWAEADTGGPRVCTRAGSAEGEYFAEADDIHVVDRRPRRAMMTDELAMRVGQEHRLQVQEDAARRVRPRGAADRGRRSAQARCHRLLAPGQRGIASEPTARSAT